MTHSGNEPKTTLGRNTDSHAEREGPSLPWLSHGCPGAHGGTKIQVDRNKHHPLPNFSQYIVPYTCIEGKPSFDHLLK